MLSGHRRIIGYHKCWLVVVRMLLRRCINLHIRSLGGLYHRQVSACPPSKIPTFSSCLESFITRNLASLSTRLADLVCLGGLQVQLFRRFFRSRICFEESDSSLGDRNLKRRGETLNIIDSTFFDLSRPGRFVWAIVEWMRGWRIFLKEA